jgi:hypothetical protein
MTRVLLVYHDENVADIEGDELRRAGYEVDRCAGPIGGEACPVLNGRPCWQVEMADVLVYDTWDTGHGHATLIEDLMDLHPDKPLVLTSPVPPTAFPPERREEVHSIPVAPSRAELAGAVERAMQGRVHTPAIQTGSLQEPAVAPGRHW